MSSFPSFGCRRGRDVPLPHVLGVHGHDDPAPPPALAGHEVGDEPVEPAVEQDLAEVARAGPRRPRARSRRLVPAATERAAEVATEQAEGRRRLVRPPGLVDDGAGLGVAAHEDAVVGERARLAPGLTLPDRHPGRPRTATSTSRARAGGDDPAVRPRRPAARRGRSPARGRVADPAQEVDQLLHVADEVATRQLLVLEDVVERLARRPGVGQVDEAGVGRPGAREARRASSSASSSAAMRSSCGEPVAAPRPTGTTAAAAACPLRCS